MKISPFRTSAARLALGYGAIFTLGVSALLGTVYFLTTRVINNEVDAVISAELEGLDGRISSARAPGTGRRAELSRRQLEPHRRDVHAGGRQPRQRGRQLDQLALRWHSRWAMDPISSSERGPATIRRSMHPVRASVSLLPDGHRLLVGIDVTPAAALRQHLPLRDPLGHRTHRTGRGSRRILPEPQAHPPRAERGRYLRCHRRR